LNEPEVSLVAVSFINFDGLITIGKEYILCENMFPDLH